MKKLLSATVALAVLAIFISSAQAFNVRSATVINGFAVIAGDQAPRDALVIWEGSGVTRTTEGGAFRFSLGAVPSYCVGELEVGLDTVMVGLSSCTPITAVAPIPVMKTGQTTIMATGDDGTLQKGVSTSPAPRFTDHLNGTVTDNLTGLIWLKNAHCFGYRQWLTAISDANDLANGACGLTDSSVAGDWRLPNRNELQSLVDLGKSLPALPLGHPFTSFQASSYWSSTTYATNSKDAWTGDFSVGHVGVVDKVFRRFATAVRGGS